VLQMLIYLTEMYMKILPKGKMQGHIRDCYGSLTADKCKESRVHISVSSRECVV
jgi:hypothetical protein